MAYVYGTGDLLPYTINATTYGGMTSQLSGVLIGDSSLTFRYQGTIPIRIISFLLS